MAATLDEQINQHKQVNADLEVKRGILGDEAVDAALFPSQQRRAELEAMAINSSVELSAPRARQQKLVKVFYLDVDSSTAKTCSGAPIIKCFYISRYLDSVS